MKNTSQRKLTATPLVVVLLTLSAITSGLYGELLPPDEINWGWGSNEPDFPNQAYGETSELDPGDILVDSDRRGNNQLFDVWVPDGEGPFPVYIFAHGGGFRGGSKILYQHLKNYLPDENIVFINVNYRLMDDDRYYAGKKVPTQGEVNRAINDVRKLINHVKGNANTYKIDPTKIFVGGNSAGGIIMSEIIYSFNEPDILGFWSLNTWKTNDYSGARLAEYPIPVVQVAFDEDPANRGHSARVAFKHAERNWFLGNSSIFMGGGDGDYSFGYQKTYSHNTQLWRDGVWIKDIPRNIADTGEELPTLGEWINDIVGGISPQATTIGSVSVHSDTPAVYSDNTYLVLTEIVDGSSSALEYEWTFNLGASESFIFSVEAFCTSSSDNDNFIFSYSTDRINWTEMLTINKTTDDDTAQVYSLPSGTSGTIYVDVLDTDRSENHTSIGSLYIDTISIKAAYPNIPYGQ